MTGSSCSPMGLEPKQCGHRIGTVLSKLKEEKQAQEASVARHLETHVCT